MPQNCIIIIIFPNWPIGIQCDFSLQRVCGTKITRLAFAFSEVSV